MLFLHRCHFSDVASSYYWLTFSVSHLSSVSGRSLFPLGYNHFWEPEPPRLGLQQLGAQRLLGLSLPVGYTILISLQETLMKGINCRPERTSALNFLPYIPTIGIYSNRRFQPEREHLHPKSILTFPLHHTALAIYEIKVCKAVHNLRKASCNLTNIYVCPVLVSKINMLTHAYEIG